VLVLAFAAFPPPLRALKAALNAACAAAAPVAFRGENFGSKWPKATLAATADGALPLSLAQLAALRRLCVAHGAALRLALAQSRRVPGNGAGSMRGRDLHGCGGSSGAAVAVAVEAVAVVHYKHRSLEALPGRTPPRLVPFALGAREATAEAADAETAAREEDTAAAAVAADEAEGGENPAAVRRVVEEWCGDRLTAYRAGANQGSAAASSYRDRSSRGSTLVAFLNGRGPAGAQAAAAAALQQHAWPSAGLPQGLAAALRSFRAAVDSTLPGRFVWMDEDSLHCTLRGLDL
jgi:hypothetical protein